MVKTWQQDGVTSRSQKEAIKLTSTTIADMQYYKKILTGKIEFDDVDFAESQFRGFIKLQKDPKGEYLDYCNIVTQSSVIMNTDWVVGIVISDDSQAVHQLWKNIFCQHQNHFDRYLSKFASLFGLLYLIQLAVQYYNISTFQFCVTIMIKFQTLPPDFTVYDILCRIIQSITFVQPSFIIGLSEIAFQLFNTLFEK